MMITTMLISTWKLTSNDEGPRVETRTHFNVKNTLLFLWEKEHLNIIIKQVFSPYFIKVAYYSCEGV